MKNDKSTPEYISNPFILAYQAAKRLLERNKWWAVALIILGTLSTFSSGDNPTWQSPERFTPATTTDISVTFIVFIVSLVLLFLIAILVFATYATGILSYVTLESEKGNKVSFGQAFQATQERFWRLLGAMGLAFIKILAWSLLFIVPGIIASLRYTLLGYVIMDESAEKTSIKDSHDRVKQIVQGRLWEVLGVSFTSIVPCVGTLFNTAGNAALYRQLQIYTDKKLDKPKIHWLNYLVPILFMVVILIVAGFIVAWQAEQAM